MACPVCASKDVQARAALLSAVDQKPYRAVRCRRCGHLFSFPLPDTSYEALQKIYDAEYTSELREGESDDSNLRLLRDATHRQLEIVEREVRPGTALNVGAMTGANQVFEERGWKLKIVEVSRHAAETARAKWGYDVAVSRLEDYEAETGSVDFVKLGHVIEHIAQPAAALATVHRVLRPGGVVLLDTDNADGFRSRVEFAVRAVLGEGISSLVVRRLTGKNLKKQYGRLIPPVHLNIFSERSLRALLTRSGFEILSVRRPAWGDPTWFPLGSQAHLSVAERAFIRLDQVAARFGYGELLSVLARKQDG